VGRGSVPYDCAEWRRLAQTGEAGKLTL
jgi:hypothetical protein